MKLVISTCREEQANEIADILLKEKLVACVNIIGPVMSKYYWQGKLEAQSECMLMMKTRDELISLVGKRIKEIHAYEVPEIVSLDIQSFNPDYSAWLQEVTRAKKQGEN